MPIATQAFIMPIIILDMLSNKPQFRSYSLEGIRSGRTVKEEREVQCKPRSLPWDFPGPPKRVALFPA